MTECCQDCPISSRVGPRRRRQVQQGACYDFNWRNVVSYSGILTIAAAVDTNLRPEPAPEGQGQANTSVHLVSSAFGSIRRAKGRTNLPRSRVTSPAHWSRQGDRR